MQHFSTRAVPRAAKLAYWQSLHRRNLPTLCVTAVSSEPFDAEYVADSLGPLTIRQTWSPPARVEVTPEAAAVAAAEARQFVLLLPIDYDLHVHHGDTDCTLAPGDFVLLDTSATSVVSFSAYNRTVSAGIPRAALASHLPDAELVAGIPIRGDRGVGCLAGNMLRTLATELEHGLPPEAGYRLAHSLLEVVATSYLTEEIVGRHGITPAQWRRLRAKRVIEAHLQDPQLSPTLVAATMGVSARYLRMLFEQEGEHLSRYIQRRRLERCADQLRGSSPTRVTLTDIAFSYGFSSMAHFSRVFREHFGMTARQYRAATLERASSPVSDPEAVS